MNRDQIITSLKALLGQQQKLKLDLNAVTEDTRLDQMGFDSISILDFMYEVETKFSTRIEVTDLVRMEVVRDLIDHLHGKAVRVNPLRRLYYLIEYAAATSLLGLLAIAPLRLTLALGEVISRAAFLLMFRRRGYAIDNILRAGVADSPAAARRLAFQSFRNFVAMVAEANAARRRLTESNWRQHVTLRITPEAEDLLNDPKQGVLVVSAHFGNWEVVGRAASMLKPLSAIYRPFNNPYLERTAHAGRSGDRLRLISKFDENPMRFVQTLARGEMLAIMIDQYAGRSGVPVEFFGRMAWTTQTVAMLHLITRCPLLLAFALRTGPLQYEVHVLGPLLYERTGDREKDVFAITQNLTREIETVIRAHPEQYMWGHRRWKQPKN